MKNSMILFTILFAQITFAHEAAVIAVPQQLVAGQFRLTESSSERCAGDANIEVDSDNHLILVNASYAIGLKRRVELLDNLDPRPGCKYVTQAEVNSSQTVIKHLMTHECDQGVHEFYERRAWKIEANKISLEIRSSSGKLQVRCTWTARPHK